MNLDELERLAKAAMMIRFGDEQRVEVDEYVLAASPDVILRLLAVVRAADALKAAFFPPESDQGWTEVKDYNAARATLEQP